MSKTGGTEGGKEKDIRKKKRCVLACGIVCVSNKSSESCVNIFFSTCWQRTLLLEK